ncbi:hypothetical protein ACM64Y_17215 [Novispirillum sp. DQ9]|uniref:hypothetical protein n=1 Tax=Novispirillum sp. DQ9 TaxID=3398612 RepID=UPI003C7AB27A
MPKSRRLPTLCLITLLATLPGTGAAVAAPPACATAAETEALRVRSLQNKLMVAALACGQDERYDAFIGRFESSLVERGRLMTAYFARRHGGKRVKRVMDDYVTTQANQHSLDSMTDRTGFCREAQETFEVLLSGGEADLLAKAIGIPDERVESPLACIRQANSAPAPTAGKTPGSAPSGG